MGGCYNSLPMTFLLALKLLFVMVVLVIFLRRPSLPWGVGLLTVTTAVLLDSILGTFNRELLLTQLGFFFYVIAGMLVGGGAFWILGALWPNLPQTAAANGESVTAVPIIAQTTPATTPNGQTSSTTPPDANLTAVSDPAGALYDLDALLSDIRQRFGREDVLDLMFDLEIPETAVMSINQTMDELAPAIVTYAAQQGKAGQLALAVERILTPPTPEMLPRLEKMTPASPRASLRYYLLAHTNLEKLQKMAARLMIDWEQLAGVEKRGKVREFLLYLYRRNRIDELLAMMQQGTGETAVAPSTESSS